MSFWWDFYVSKPDKMWYLFNDSVKRETETQSFVKQTLSFWKGTHKYNGQANTEHTNIIIWQSYRIIKFHFKT